MTDFITYDTVKTKYWHVLSDGRIQCDVCPRFCKLHEGQRGLCFVRQNLNNEIVMTSYGRSSGFAIDPIEKKPLNHFLPGSSVFSFGTAGCNLACKFCQNWDISKSREMDTLMSKASPEAIARAACEHGCKSVAYTYNDPVDDYLAPVGAPENLVRAAVLEAVRRPGRIDVRCQDDPALPWAFVYDPALDPTVDEEVVRFERFWGFVHELQVEHANTARDPRIAVPFVLKAAACPRVDSARSARQDDRTLHGSAVTSGRLDWIDDAEKLRTALRELDGDGLYVLGHAGSGDSGAPSDRWIQFDGAKVYVSDLLRAPRPARSERQALVFLNACESAAIEEWDECTLPGALLKRHADRITLIGTTAEVPRLLAMAFAKEFWRRFLGGSTAGEALLDTRVCLLREYTNPFGLLYTLHGKADTHLRAPDETTDVGVVAREERVVARPLAASFAEVCTDPRKIEMFVYSAGVPRSLVYVHQSPLKAWESVCDVARRFGRTEALTAVVVEYYPRVFDVVSTRSV